MLNVEAVTCLRSRLMASAGSFHPCSPEDRCTCNPPVQSRCRWHYPHRAWTSTDECLLGKKEIKYIKIGLDCSRCAFSLLLLLSCFCACFLLLPPFPSSRSCSHHSILSPSGKTENSACTSKQLVCSGRREEACVFTWRSTGEAQICFAR